MEIPLASNTAEQDVSGSELLLNVYPRKTTGGKYQFNLIGTPGLALFAELPTFPVLGLHENGERAFAVTPSKMYEIFNDGSFTELGDVDLKGRVSLEDNGYQLVVVDGIKGYYYDSNTELVQQITDEAFYPSSSVTYQDGYFIFNRNGTGQFFISELLDVAFDANDYATAEGQPDNLVKCLSDHREIFMFGEQSIEVWYNSGAADFPLERNQGAFVEKGCAARHTVVKQNNTVYFVGSDFMVYSMAGYTPVRISTHAVEKTLKGVDLSDSFAYTYKSEGHLFYVLTIPANNITWCYDISTGSWHIRQSYQFERHQANCSISYFGKTLVGDFQNGRIYNLSDEHYTDDNDPIVRKFVLPTVNIGRKFLGISSLELDMSTGVGTATGQGENPAAFLTNSKDNGSSWSNEKKAYIGKTGKTGTRVKWTRLGTARQFIFQVTITDPVKIDIGGAHVEFKV